MASAQTGIAIRPIPTPRPYLTWLHVAVTSGLVIALYAGVVVEMVRAWDTEPGASQGFLIPPLAAYIAWIRRRRTLSEPVQPDNRGLWIIAGSCVLFLLGRMGAEFFLTRVSLVLLITGVIGTFWGFRRLRTLLFPLLLLATMIPVPALIYNQLALPLQLFASEVATWAAQLAGVAVFRDGNIINLAHISLGVAEACSGLHSLSALLVASLLVGFLDSLGIAKRILLVLGSVVIAIAVNAFRVAFTAILADHQPDLAEGFYHLFAGWLIFLCGFGLVRLSSLMLARLGRHPSAV